MKKSKFLKNSRDMLSRSFNPSKCKTSLRLAGSRLKLLRNKKEVQLKQMKREIAQLLESGQDQTARIRVEHVIREEKMMAAFNLIEIYCELIVARLPIIESQKICPIDLKEAIASIVFASPRCGDVPELLDVRKHFTEKYGKDFTTAALEVRPDCGVSRMLIEKLSAVAPDGQTKTKILSAIAEEHNVKWDPKSFEENSIPASDLLTGPSTFGKEHFERPDVQVPHSNNKVHGSPLNFTQVDNKASMETGRLPSSRSSGINPSVQHEARPPGDERSQLFQGSSNTISLDRQRWNMEFKDATSAAQAAAESAELASLAARAAAQLSSRGRHDYSTESPNSDTNVSKDGVTEAYMNSNFSSGQFSQESMNRSFSGRTRSQDDQTNRMKPNNLKTDERFRTSGHAGTEKYSKSDYLKSKASTGNDSLDHHVPVLDGYSWKNSLKEVSGGEVSMQRESFKAESANGWQEKSENAREERIRYSHSDSSRSNDVNLFSNPGDPKSEDGAVDDSFSGFGKKGSFGEASQTDSGASAAVVFDKSDSDSENHKFDVSPTYDEVKQQFHLTLSGRKLHDHLSTNTDSWSPRSTTSKTLKSSESLFLNRKSSSSDSSERSMDGHNPDDSMPAAFDESDGSTSESDEYINRSRHSRIPKDFLSRQNQSFGSQLKEKGSPGLNRKQLSPSFDDGLMSAQMDRERKQGKKPDTGNSSPEREGGLNFERLTGGLRHKGYNHPPYLKKRSDVSSSFIKEGEETTSTATPAEKPRTGTMIEHKKSRTPYLQSVSDIDSSGEEESLQKNAEHKETYTPSVGKRDDIVRTKPSLVASNSFFGSDNLNSDEDLPKESFDRRSHLLRGGISRRTKAFPSGSKQNNNSKIMQGTSDKLDSDDGIDTKRPTKSYVSEPQQRFQSTKGNTSSVNVASRISQDHYNLGKENPRVIQESKVTQKSTIEESPIPPRTTGASLSSENLLNKTYSNKDSSNQKASHVHPNLPDYDTLVQSLRKNRS